MASLLLGQPGTGKDHVGLSQWAPKETASFARMAGRFIRWPIRGALLSLARVLPQEVFGLVTAQIRRKKRRRTHPFTRRRSPGMTCSQWKGSLLKNKFKN